MTDRPSREERLAALRKRRDDQITERAERREQPSAVEERLAEDPAPQTKGLERKLERLYEGVPPLPPMPLPE